MKKPKFCTSRNPLIWRFSSTVEFSALGVSGEVRALRLGLRTNPQAPTVDFQNRNYHFINGDSVETRQIYVPMSCHHTNN
jgi:hypothetical protein